MAKLNAKEFVEALESMTMLEIKELLDAMKEKFGVDPSAVAVAGPAQAVVEEGPKEVTVTLTEVGASKVGVIKVVRELLGLGLIEAKTLVDKAPVAIKENIQPEEAEEIVKKLTEAGAKAEVK